MMRVKGFDRNADRVDSYVPDITWSGDILPYMNRVSMVCRTKQQASDIVRWFGHEDFCPWLPILLCIPGGWGQLAGLGLATASEMRDEAVARWELQEARISKTGAIFDFASAREKAGLPQMEDVPELMREAFHERIKAHKASPVTDPPRQLAYPKVNDRNLFVQPDNSGWKEASE